MASSQHKRSTCPKCARYHLDTELCELDPDKLLSAYGKYGRYQMITYVLTNAVMALYAMIVMVPTLIEGNPSVRCQFEPPPNSSWIYSMKSDPNQTVEQQCELLDGNNWTIACLDVPGASYAIDDRNSLSAEYSLVCRDKESFEHAESIFMLGGMIASPLITQLSDSVGRRLTFIIPLWIFTLSNFACALAPTYPMFLLFRFIAGFGAASFTSIGWVLCIESVAVEFRSLIPLVSQVAWVLGYELVGVLHYFVLPNWRHLLLAITAPGLITITFYWILPESLHWMINHRRSGGVQRYLRRSMRINRRDVCLAECRGDEDETGGEGDKSDTTTSSSSQKRGIASRSLFDIFKRPVVLTHFLVHCYIMVVINLTYWAISLFSTELSDDGMTGYFLSGLVELPAGLLSVPLLLGFGRRTVTFYFMLLQGLAMILAAYAPGPRNVRMIFTLIAKSFNTIIWSSEPIHMTEMAPTSVRNVYFGSAGFVGDLGSVLAPYLKRLEHMFGENAPALLIGIMSIIAAAAVLALPETKGRALPDDLDDVEPGPLLSRLGVGPLHGDGDECDEEEDSGSLELCAKTADTPLVSPSSASQHVSGQSDEAAAAVPLKIAV